MSGRDVLAVRDRPTLDPSTLLRVSGPSQGGLPPVLSVGLSDALGARIPDLGPEVRKGGIYRRGATLLAMRSIWCMRVSWGSTPWRMKSKTKWSRPASR